MLRCYNRGCGQEYDPEKNTDDSCRHHPGAPFFHDAYKGWSCCNKKSVDFTEFLNIKGCTVSKHSNVKPPEPVKPVVAEEEEKEKVVEVRAPIREPLPRPPFNTPMVEIQPTVAPALKEFIENLPTNKQDTNCCDAVKSDSTIAIGTSCKNSGCNYSHSGTTADSDECQYHSGIPIFHEGMKYWSCCQRKTTDFAVFMSQKGCMHGQHKWQKDNDKKVMQCRYDWHQTATDVILSIYAKKYHYAKSKIEVNPIRLHVTLLFPEQNDAIYDLNLELRGMIDTAKTTAHMFGSKVEITMSKAEPGTWAKLDFPQKALTQTKADENKQNSKAKVNNVDDDDDDDDFNLDDVNTMDKTAHLSEIST